MSTPIIESPAPVLAVRPVRRYTLLYLLLILALSGLIGRSFYLQVVAGTGYRAAAENNRVALTPKHAPRGIITDRNGVQLVENIASTDVVLDPVTLPTEENEALLVDSLAALLPIPAEEIHEAIRQTRAQQRAVVLLKAVDHDTVLRLEEAQDELPGLTLASSLIRSYPKGEALAQIIGYTNLVTEDELQNNDTLLPTDITGKTGIEKYYDAVLRGTHGAQYTEVNVSGQAQKLLGDTEPTPGTNLQLTIDSELQQFITDLLHGLPEESEGIQPAAVVAIDPRSGAIRALVSHPSFDPNIFSQPKRRQEIAPLFSREPKPLFNRAVDGTYPPGSTIKPFLAAASLAEGVITPDTTVQSIGGLQIGPWRFPDWKAGGHGLTDVGKAIAESVNTFFYIAIGGDETRTGLGVERGAEYLRTFGWGAPTGIDLASEAAGFLPSKEWKETVKKEPWYIGDTYHFAIGQGDVLATPLQVAVATATIANGGSRPQPHLVATAEPPIDALEERTLQSVPIDASHIATVRSGMRETVEYGSGVRLSTLPIALAGKTGTAQIGGSEDTHAWFTSFGPYESPELVLTVLLERGGAGDTDAVPVAFEIWRWWYDHRQAQQATYPLLSD